MNHENPRNNQRLIPLTKEIIEAMADWDGMQKPKPDVMDMVCQPKVSMKLLFIETMRKNIKDMNRQKNHNQEKEKEKEKEEQNYDKNERNLGSQESAALYKYPFNENEPLTTSSYDPNEMSYLMSVLHESIRQALKTTNDGRKNSVTKDVHVDHHDHADKNVANA